MPTIPLIPEAWLRTLWRAALYVGLPWVLTALVFHFHLSAQVTQFKELQHRLQASQLQEAAAITRARLGFVEEDLHYVASSHELALFLQQPTPARRQDLEQRWLELLNSRLAHYDQIRYLNEDGQELARINAGPHGAQVTPLKDLQNKATRFYFQRAIALAPGQTYVSPMDLNVEGDQIEQPLKPTLRLSLRVADAQGRARGVVVINYRAKTLLERLRSLYAGEQVQLSMLNRQGYWLISPQPEQEWGFMLPERKQHTLAQSDPERWARLQALAPGLNRLEEVNGSPQSALTFKPGPEVFDSGSQVTMDPDLEWLFLSELPAKFMAERYTQIRDGLWPAYAALATLLGLLALVAARLQGRRMALTKVLLELDEEYEALLEAANDAIIVSDEAGRIVLANAAAQRVFGYSRDEMLQRTIDSLLPAAQRGAHPGLRAAFLQNPRARRMGEDRPIFACRRDGQTFPVTISLSSFHSGPGRRVLAIVRDVTQLRADEEALRDALQQAQAANAAKSRFISVISHEIRTPLNGVLGGLQLLDHLVQDPEARTLIKGSLDSGELLLSVISDVLDFQKIQAGKVELDPHAARLSDTLLALERMLQQVPRDAGVGLHFHCDPELEQAVLVDDMRLRQVITNLVNNALKFTHAGSVQVRAQVQARSNEALEVDISVQDSGIGMSPEVLAKVFEPFTQADGSHTRKYGGTGLGLSICQALVSAMGGHLSARSVQGQGSTFSVRLSLPITDLPTTDLPTSRYQPLPPPSGATDPGPVVTAAPADQPASASTGPGPGWAGKHVLVVDDVAVNRMVAGAMLGRLGAQVSQASDGSQALSMLRDQALQVDLVLMDMQMPAMDGLQATRLLRASGQPRLERLPVVAMTGNVALDDRLEVQAAGMNDFLSKPLSLVELNSLAQKLWPS